MDNSFNGWCPGPIVGNFDTPTCSRPASPKRVESGTQYNYPWDENSVKIIQAHREYFYNCMFLWMSLSGTDLQVCRFLRNRRKAYPNCYVRSLRNSRRKIYMTIWCKILYTIQTTSQYSSQWHLFSCLSREFGWSKTMFTNGIPGITTAKLVYIGLFFEYGWVARRSIRNCRAEKIRGTNVWNLEGLAEIQCGYLWPLREAAAADGKTFGKVFQISKARHTFQQTVGKKTTHWVITKNRSTFCCLLGTALSVGRLVLWRIPVM